MVTVYLPTCFDVSLSPTDKKGVRWILNMMHEKSVSLAVNMSLRIWGIY